MRDEAKVEGLGLLQGAKMDYPGNKLPRITFGVTDLKSCTSLSHRVLGYFFAARKKHPFYWNSTFFSL